MQEYRNKRVTLTEDHRKQYQTTAAEEERGMASTIAQARRAKARAEMLREVLHQLKAERERQGLSLSDISSRCGLDKAALSRLENAANANPKLDTLTRYADALGAKLNMSLVPGKAA